MNEIKHTYNPIYTYSFGRVRIDPTKRAFFKSP